MFKRKSKRVVPVLSPGAPSRHGADYLYVMLSSYPVATTLFKHLQRKDIICLSVCTQAIHSLMWASDEAIEERARSQLLQARSCPSNKNSNIPPPPPPAATPALSGPPPKPCPQCFFSFRMTDDRIHALGMLRAIQRTMIIQESGEAEIFSQADWGWKSLDYHDRRFGILMPCKCKGVFMCKQIGVQLSGGDQHIYYFGAGYREMPFKFDTGYTLEEIQLSIENLAIEPPDEHLDDWMEPFREIGQTYITNLNNAMKLELTLSDSPHYWQRLAKNSIECQGCKISGSELSKTHRNRAIDSWRLWKMTPVQMRQGTRSCMICEYMFCSDCLVFVCLIPKTSKAVYGTKPRPSSNGLKSFLMTVAFGIKDRTPSGEKNGIEPHYNFCSECFKRYFRGQENLPKGTTTCIRGFPVRLWGHHGHGTKNMDLMKMGVKWAAVWTDSVLVTKTQGPKYKWMGEEGWVLHNFIGVGKMLTWGD